AGERPGAAQHARAGALALAGTADRSGRPGADRGGRCAGGRDAARRGSAAPRQARRGRARAHPPRPRGDRLGQDESGRDPGDGAHHPLREDPRLRPPTLSSSTTRFFCRCGRLITVDATTREVVCPTCRTRNQVPGLDAAAVPPPIPSIPSVAPAPPAPASPPSIAGVPVAAAAAAPENGAAIAILDLRIGGRLGRFELVRVVGHGGMGTVYQARDTSVGRDVALKVLHPVLQSRPDFVSRFQREARAASALNHENIVPFLDSGIERGTPWIAMELLEGEDLLASAQRGIVTPVNAPLFMLQSARGLAAAAAVGITHRDVKPGNLVLRRDGVLKI